MVLKFQENFPAPDIPSILNRFMTEIDALLAVQFGTGATKARIVYVGNDAVLLSLCINRLIKTYINAGWEVKDMSGNKKDTYILEVTHPKLVK